jgi:hypothetical protein
VNVQIEAHAMIEWKKMGTKEGEGEAAFTAKKSAAFVRIRIIF